MYTEPLRQVAVRSYARYWLMPLQTSAAKLGPIIESTEFYNFLLNSKPKRIPLPSLYYKRDVVNPQRETFILMTEAPGFLQGTRILTVGFDRIFYPAIRDNSISARKSVIFVVKEGRYMIMKDRSL